MEIIRDNENWNKLKTPIELGEELAEYSEVLSNGAFFYLESLARLEQSAVSIPDVYEKLKELDIYKKILIHNLYYRTLNIFKDDSNLEISGFKQGLNGLVVNAKIGNKIVPIYELDYVNHYVNSILYKSVIDKKYNEEQKVLLSNKIEELENENDPIFYDYHERLLRKYRSLLRKLNNREYTDADYKEVELTQKYQELMLQEYMLKENDFKPYTDYLESEPHMENKLVKKMPNLLIESKTKYL